MADSKIELTKNKQTEFNEWYVDVVMKTELLDYYAVSGCYIMLPASYKMWEQIQCYIDAKLKQIGVDNVYFPLLIPETYLNKEANHVAGFAHEMIWLATHETEKSNNETQNVRLCIRPTSETGIYPTFSKKVRSHADLPILWNQWCNVMRFEISSPTPFIRSKEFLWQEGHCAFATNEQMYENIKNVLKIYKKFYEDFLCLPVIVGKKVETEKFAGAVATYSIETFIPEANKSIQAATVHNLGQNFSKMFDIKFLKDLSNAKEGVDIHDYAIQSSWGLTTRSIGTVIMTHSDNSGLILPPDLAPTQIVIVPISYAKDKDLNSVILSQAYQLKANLSNNFRIIVDDTEKRPAVKYYYHEITGVPLRIEIGPNDARNKTVTLCNRVSKTKMIVNIDSLNVNMIKNIFSEIKKYLFTSACNKMITEHVFKQEDIMKIHEQKKLVSVNLCDDEKCDEYIRNTYKLKPICRPINENLDVICTQTIQSNCIDCIVCKKGGKLCLLSKTF